MKTETEELKDWDVSGFGNDLLQWYQENKRDLPWRRERDPYRIWVSEIMLQQTKVDTVIPYYENFMALFPTAEALAEAEEETVLKAWEGLGYYSRARNLHQAVKEVKEQYGGKVPDTKEEVHKLRGVGPYTAGAILSIAYNKPEPAVDGNVMRVLSRLFLIGDDITKSSARKKFEAIAAAVISKDNPSDFNQALMELGAMICTPRSPACLLCPVQQHCLAREEGVQEQLPVKAKKLPPKMKKMKAAIIEDEEGRLLIEKRPEKGLLANLWQFPNMELEEGSSEDPVAESLKKAGLRTETEQASCFEVRHVFSHLIWEIDVHFGKSMGFTNEQKFNESRLKFVTKEEIRKYPFPVSHQKIIDYALKGEA